MGRIQSLMNSIELASLKEVKTATRTLDKASLCPITIDDNGVSKPVKHLLAIYNNSKGLMTCSVGRSYHLVQHKEYFDSFCEALDNLGIKYTAIINQGTNVATMDINFIGRNIKFKDVGEEFTTGIRVVNSYNRLKGVSICPRYTRLACTNGMVLSRFDMTFSIRHNSKLIPQLEVLIETKINSIINKDEELKMWVSDSMADSVEWNTAHKILTKLIVSLKHREQILKTLGISVIVEKEKGKKKKLSYVLDDNRKSKITRWEIYNAVTQFCSHGAQVTPLLESTLQKQAEKILITKLSEIPIEVTVSGQ